MKPKKFPDRTRMTFLLAGVNVISKKDFDIVENIDDMNFGGSPSPELLSAYWCLLYNTLPKHPELVYTFKRYGLRTELVVESNKLNESDERTKLMRSIQSCRKAILSCQDVLPLLLGIDPMIDEDIEGAMQ